MESKGQMGTRRETRTDFYAVTPYGVGAARSHTLLAVLHIAGQ